MHGSSLLPGVHVGQCCSSRVLADPLRSQGQPVRDYCWCEVWPFLMSCEPSGRLGEENPFLVRSQLSVLLHAGVAHPRHASGHSCPLQTNYSSMFWDAFDLGMLLL